MQKGNGGLRISSSSCYIEFKKRCLKIITIEAPSGRNKMKKFIYHIEHTYGDDQNVWTTAENEYEAEQDIRHNYHSIKSLTLRKVEDMYLENGDEVIEAGNGKLILANSGAYCDEDGNPTGGCIDDDKEEFVYVTKTGGSYHTNRECVSLKARKPELKKISLLDARKQGYKACKRCQKN